MTRTREIIAVVNPDAQTIEMTGDTYPLRAELVTTQFIWNTQRKSWIGHYTPERAAYATSVATRTDVIPQTDQTTTAAWAATTAWTATAIAQHIADTAAQAAATDKPVTVPPRRRVQRSATDQTTGQTQQTPDADTASALLAAMQAFVAQTQPTQQQQAPAPVIDLTQVQAMIDVSVAKALQSVVATRVEVIQKDKPETVVEGLHHYMLPTLIRAIKTGQNVWIAGPSGGGKTHAAEQAAQALGLEFTLQGSMTMAHELIGFKDAGGRYDDTQFVRTFRNGGLILLDELDAGSSEALLTLNAALSNGILPLPSGEILRRRKDFFCIGGANTYGHGATSEYTGRTKIDAAFLQRFGVRLKWEYDEKLETAMTGNKAWSERVQRARQKAKLAGLKVLITPRASLAGAALIQAGFTAQEAAEMTYLADLTEAQRKQVE